MSNIILPSLPLDEWEDTKNTLHLFMQIIGKIRMSLFPKTNHWWHVPLYVSCRGLTTRPIPVGDKLIDINLDFIDHQLIVLNNNGPSKTFPLHGVTVAEFYSNIIQALAELDITVDINAKPYDLPFSSLPFAEDHIHASYDQEYVEKYWHILSFVNGAFEVFRGRFLGKSTPVHLFWHHGDLALTRFSGKLAPPLTSGSQADKEAYSHEVISFGFWAGDANTREPAFYAYMYPETSALTDMPLKPGAAHWNNDYGYSMAFLRYEDIRETRLPTATLLEFLESAYQACAQQAGWDSKALALS